MPDDIKAEIVERFTRIARKPQDEHNFPVGPNSAKALGYESSVIDELAASITESFSGVGNPLGLGMLRHGEAVLDVGCGAGLDSILAARAVEPTGKVVGVDITKPMIEKAKKNAQKAEVTNVRFVQSAVENLPLENESVDVAISNGVLNLCPDKAKVLREIFRVLRGGGRLQMADILLEENVLPEEVARKGAWSD
jgi:SAM-dependent methyltransferase